MKLLTTRFYYISACVWSSYVLVLMLLLNRWLLLVIKFKLHSYFFWFWKLLILSRNQKGFFLSLVYKHLKGRCAYTRKGKGTQLKKTSNAYTAFFKTGLFIEWMKKFVVLLMREKRLRVNGKIMTLTFFLLQIC